jgi:hypothetical protein
MASTNTLRDALVADLTAITVAGGFNTTLAEVLAEPDPEKETLKPAAVLTSGPGGTSDQESLTNTKGLAVQQFVVELHIQSATPQQDMDDLLDDVRNAAERSNSNLLAVAGTEMVTATEWDEAATDTPISQGTYIRKVTVEIRYLYTRGSL